VFEIIRQHPSCLAGLSQATAYLRGDSGQSPDQERLPTPEAMVPVLKSLLDLGVIVANKAAIVRMTRDAMMPGGSWENAVEAAFVQVRPRPVEIQARPEYLTTLIPKMPILQPASVYAEGIDESLRAPFRRMEDRVFEDLGLRLPDILWVPSASVPEGTIAVKINDHLGLPVPALQPGDLFVSSPAEQVRMLGVAARPAVHPVDGDEGALVAEASKERISEAGLAALMPLDYVALLVQGEVSRLADRLLSIGEVEDVLAQLDQAFPELLQATLMRFSVEEITRVLRGLIRERVSIRNLRSILEALIQYDTIPIVPRQKHVVLDDRLPLPERTPPEAVRNWRNYCAFVRSRLKSYLSYRYAEGYSTLVAYRISSDLEARAETVGTQAETVAGAWLSDAEGEAFRDAVWAAVSNLTAPSVKPVILTTTGARAAIRDLIAPELPDLPVVAYSELRPDMNIQSLDTITLSGTGRMATV
jgi:type III secretion protein V